MRLVKSFWLGSLFFKSCAFGSVVILTGVAAAWAGGAGASSLSLAGAAPINYAGMCDIYGNSFFYLPGTDSCLKIGGLAYGELDTFSPSDSVNGQTFEGNGTPAGSGYRPNRTQYVTAGQRNAVGYQSLGRIELDARKATAYGPMRVFVRGDTLFGSTDYGLASGDPGSIYNSNVRAVPILNKAFIQFAGLTAGYAQSSFDFYADADNWGYLRGSNATVPLLAYTATFGKGFSTTLSFEDHYWRRAAIGSTVANYQAMPTSNAAPDIVGNLRLDRPWGAMQLSGASHQIRSNLYGTTPSGTLSSSANSNSDFGFAVQGGLQFNTDMIAPGDKLWLQAAYEKGAYSYVGGDNLASAYAPANGSRYYGVGVSPQDYNFGWDPQIPSDCVYTGVTAATAHCSKPWGFAFTGAFKHYWTPTLSSAVFGSYLSTNYDASALAGLGGAVGVADTKETRIGGSLVWTPIKGLDIGTEFMYLHLSESTPAGLAPNYGATSLGAAGVPTFKNNSNEYEGRIRVQRAF
ncbi:Porin Omp2b [Methylovirgula sp. HY1]|nr:Porin Omp2b [Methylovirgula sp. HY1]